MSVLKQITGLEDIAPLWNKKIIDDNFEPESGLNLNLSPFCIVGEAHGYNWPYGCKDCEFFSGSLWFLAKLEPRKIEEDKYYVGKLGVNVEFINELNKFVTHFNTHHRS